MVSWRSACASATRLTSPDAAKVCPKLVFVEVSAHAPLSTPPREPQRRARERRSAARHVEQAVIDGAGARWEEALVILVHERDAGDEREGREPPESSVLLTVRSAESAHGEQRQQRVLGEVRGLADEEVDVGERLLGDVGEEPEEQRPDDARRVRRGEARRRGEEHEARPGRQRHVAREEG